MDIFSVNFAPNEFFLSLFRPHGSFLQFISSLLNIGSAQFTHHPRSRTVYEYYIGTHTLIHSLVCIFLYFSFFTSPLHFAPESLPFHPRAKFRPIWETLR